MTLDEDVTNGCKMYQHSQVLKKTEAAMMLDSGIVSAEGSEVTINDPVVKAAGSCEEVTFTAYASKLKALTEETTVLLSGAEATNAAFLTTGFKVTSKQQQKLGNSVLMTEAKKVVVPGVTLKEAKVYTAHGFVYKQRMVYENVETAPKTDDSELLGTTFKTSLKAALPAVLPGALVEDKQVNTNHGMESVKLYSDHKNGRLDRSLLQVEVDSKLHLSLMQLHTEQETAEHLASADEASEDSMVFVRIGPISGGKTGTALDDMQNPPFKVGKAMVCYTNMESINLPQNIATDTGMTSVKQGLTVFADMSVGKGSSMEKAYEKWPLRNLPKTMQVSMHVDFEAGSLELKTTLAGDEHPWELMSKPKKMGVLQLTKFSVQIHMVTKPQFSFKLGVEGQLVLSETFLGGKPFSFPAVKGSLAITGDGIDIALVMAQKQMILIDDKDYPVTLGPFMVGFTMTGGEVSFAFQGSFKVAGFFNMIRALIKASPLNLQPLLSVLEFMGRHCKALSWRFLLRTHQ